MLGHLYVLCSRGRFDYKPWVLSLCSLEKTRLSQHSFEEKIGSSTFGRSHLDSEVAQSLMSTIGWCLVSFITLMGSQNQQKKEFFKTYLNGFCGDYSARVRPDFPSQRHLLLVLMFQRFMDLHGLRFIDCLFLRFDWRRHLLSDSESSDLSIIVLTESFGTFSLRCPYLCDHWLHD